MLDFDARAVEALLFVATDPLLPTDLCEPCGLSQTQVDIALSSLDREYEECGHALRLERSSAGVRLVTAAEFGTVVARFQGHDRRPRLSAAALDALAIVAYRQPVTRAAVEALRGVGSDHVLTVLLNMGLIEEVGRAESIGRPVLYGTSPSFLESAGLTSLADLPPLEEAVRPGTLFD